MFFVWRCATARIPLVTGFWACAATTTVRGKAQRARRAVPSMDLIPEAPVKGVVAAAQFCIGKVLPSRLDWCMHLLLLLALLVGSASAPAAALAQSNAERVANDTYSRSHDYDVLHQRIEVRNFDWDSTSLDGRVTTTLGALRPGLGSVILDAGKGAVVSGVADARGATLRRTGHSGTP